MDWVVQSLNAVKGSAQGLSQLSISIPTFQNSGKREFSSNNANYYTMEHFKMLCDDLLCLNPARDSHNLIETLRTITELLIWSDHNKANETQEDPIDPEKPTTPDFFEYFLEHNLHVYMCWVLGLGTSSNPATSNTRWGSNFLQSQMTPSSPFSGVLEYSNSGSPISSRVSISSSTLSPVLQDAEANKENARIVNYDLIQLKIQVLQSLNILFESLRTPQVFYYLLSNNFINRLVTRPRLDVQTHEELVPYYVALLKALASKLATHPESLTPFFFNAQNRDLPLYVEAIRYYDHHDAMVRVAIRTLTLNIYSVNNIGLSRVVVDPCNQHFLVNMLKSLARLPLSMEKALGLPSTPSGIARTELDASEFRSRLAEFLEQLDYLSDILRLSCAPIRVFIRPQAFKIVIEPIILNNYPLDTDSSEEVLSYRPPRSTLHLLLVNHIFRSLGDGPLLNLALQTLFDLDPSLLSGPPLSRLISQVPTLLNVDTSLASDNDNTPEDKNDEDWAEKEEELRFFALYSKNRSKLKRKNIFSGFKTIWEVFDGQLQNLPSHRRSLPRRSFSTNSYQTHESKLVENASSQDESHMLLLITLSSTLCKKTELRYEWLLNIGLCPVRQVRAWFIMDALTNRSNSDIQPDYLDGERRTIIEWLNPSQDRETGRSPSPESSPPEHHNLKSSSHFKLSKFQLKHKAPSLCEKLPKQVWYHCRGPLTLLKFLLKNSRLHFITPRLASSLLLDLVYFPGTESCLEAPLARRLEILIHDISSRIQQYLTHSNCPLLLILFEFEQFQNSIEQIPQRLLGIDSLVIFGPSLDPLKELGSPLAQVSRTVQMFLLFHRLSHWLLRTNAAIPTWWKNIKSYFDHQPIVLNSVVLLDSFHVISVDITWDSRFKPKTSGDYVLLLKDSQTQFILATVERKTFSKNRKAIISQVFPLIESEISDISGHPQQLRIVRKQFFCQDRGLAKFSGAHSFPVSKETWAATLCFHDYIDSCQASQNLRLAREQSLSVGRAKISEILELSSLPTESFKTVQDPLGAVPS